MSTHSLEPVVTSKPQPTGKTPLNGGFGAFVMTYNRCDLLPHTVELLLGQSVPPDAVLIVDNASTDATAEAVRNMNHPAIEYIKLPQNIGPAGAAAAGIDWARQSGFEWVYWGDDDDPPRRPNAFERLFKMMGAYGREDVGAMGVVGSRWDWRSGEMTRVADDELAGPVEVDSIGGNSTFLINRRAFDSVDPPDQTLFFGLEESEYCLRIRKSGLKILVDGDQMLESRQRNNRLNLKTKAELRSRWTVKVAHRPVRQYYSTRNYIFMMRQTFGRPDLARREAMKSIARSGAAWLRGPRYGFKFTRLQLKGVIDGYRRRMGKTVPLR